MRLHILAIAVAFAMAASGQSHAADCSAEQDAYHEWRASHSGEGPDPNDKCAMWSWCMEVNGAKMALISCQCEGNPECVKHNKEKCGQKPPGC
jgi:hypothetical protein